jgi:hypothetical protein
LEEIDKFKLSDFAYDTVFNLINVLMEEEGRLVLNANLNWQEFQDVFGTEIARRVKEICVIKDYWS